MFIAASVAITLAVLSPVSGQQAHQHEVPRSSAPCGSRTRAPQRCSRRSQGRWRSFIRSSSVRRSQSFDSTAAADPGCAIAYWGIAVSRWGNPFAPGAKPPKEVELGRAAAEKAKAIGAKTERERDFIAAVDELYRDFEHARSAHAGPGVPRRDGTGRQAVQRRPGSVGLLRASARGFERSDRPDLRQPAQGGRHPRGSGARSARSPGIRSLHHPRLRRSAARAPRRSTPRTSYAKIAPSAPHALHMPSHTFTRLGYWQDSIDTNIASAEAARREKSTGRRAARDGLPDLRLSPNRAGQRRAPSRRRAARDRGALRSGPDRFGAALARRASLPLPRSQPATRSSGGRGVMPPSSS